jgi:hypothetical protein
MECKLSAHVAQVVEHILGKDEVTGSNPVVGLSLFNDTVGNFPGLPEATDQEEP